ncbi:DNA mismatch repair protein Msh6 isoform X2 [Arctopsyche grandis]|uniref:DNA mismatch repair protein Msh6 isoform X2 n=1 Tax=Arctopsyche grandis TaxID=121162 RepID=UPI00406D8D3D
MSRRSNVGGSPGGNTLFNYFTKSPKAAGAATPTATAAATKDNNSPNNTPANTPTRKRATPQAKKLLKTPTNGKNHDSDVDDDDEIPTMARKKRIRLISDDSSDEENKDRNNVKPDLESSFKFEKRTAGDSPQTPKNKKAKIDNGSETISTPKSKLQSDDIHNWAHCQLDWLRPEKIKDAEKRRPDHPDYDPRTLFVPSDFRKNQTPAHKQWWDMKSAHYDCVLFFKVGKFYELYHMDASVGVNELGFSYMKGDFAHSGFPETAYARMASTLVQKGYRVARVEQTETPDMLQERMKSSNIAVKEKVVQREICQVTCKGTEVCGLQDNGPTDAKASYMLAIAEQDLGSGCSRYGVCFIDTSIGIFHLGQFDDDRHSSRLLTTLAHYPPVLVLRERGVTSDRTNKVLRMSCQSAKLETLKSQKQFWSETQTLKTMAEKYYQKDSGTMWPEGLKPMLSDADALGLTPSEKYSLAIRSLGACLWYLTDSLLDIQIMEMSNFVTFEPPDCVSTPIQVKSDDLPNNMILDATTLMNLRIVGDDMSLLSKLDHCATPMGKRLLHQWVCSPSCNVDVIKERQDAISYLLSNQSIVQEMRATLNSLPDMERLFAKIHSLGNLNRSKNHPDSRAILYEEKTYSKRKVLDFISILNGFQSALQALPQFGNSDSTLLTRLTQHKPDGQYPNYSETLTFFKDSFDRQLAEKEGKILPKMGVDTEYDGTLQEISDIELELQDYLKIQEKYFNCKVVYFGSDKKRYQLEVPESKANKAGSKYQMEGARKGFKRYSTAETKEFLARMQAAEENKHNVLKDLSRRIFEKFSQSYSTWQKAINCIATLDVIIALSEYARLQSSEMCVPKVSVTQPGDKPYILIKDGRHPCVTCSVDFIPNDASLNNEDTASLILLTGPNMGGKSTLMRQIGLLTIMAQMGCHIPAAECSLTVIDRIFTRLGAHDDIMSGQSTFLVELSETAAILKHTTINSLVLLDELGRGTSTYDGTAIAASVVEELSNRHCRTIFSTHYHTLVEDFKNNSNVTLAHMACMVETDESESENADGVTQETVTFLYKLSTGACPKSYGFNAARLAGIQKDITTRAHHISTQMEKEANFVSFFKRMCVSDNIKSSERLRDLIVACKKI